MSAVQIASAVALLITLVAVVAIAAFGAGYRYCARQTLAEMEKLERETR